MTERTYGAVERMQNGWRITEIEPHVALRLKAVFPRIPRTGRPPFQIIGTEQVDADLQWFMQRYPLRISDADRQDMTQRKVLFEKGQAELGFLLSEHWKPSGAIAFREGENPYVYQSQAAELCRRKGGLLLADDLGLGKTVSALATICDPLYLPALIVAPTHLIDQWREKIAEFTHLDAHVIKKSKPYELPKADIYLITYTRLSGWIDYAERSPFRSIVMEEAHELRNGRDTSKGKAVWAYRQKAVLALALTATPIFNYGSEIFPVMEYIEEGALGTYQDFTTEWCSIGPGGKWVVNDPSALGTFLREKHLMLRRTNEDVGREHPPINVLTPEVPYDESVIESEEDAMRSLAQRVLGGSFTDRGMAAREFDLRMRRATGVAKAPHVAQFVKMLLDSGEPVILCGWHRECFAKGTPVMMFDGTIRPVEHVRVGDRVMGPNSQPRTVKSLTAGTGPLFRVVPNRGDPWVCSENHVLALKHERKSGTILMTASEFASLSDRQKRSFVLFRSGAVDFGGESTVEPWLLGYWLGDGAASLHDLRISSADTEVSSEVAMIAARHGLSTREWESKGASGDSNCRQIAISSGRSGSPGRNRLLNLFRAHGLHENKHIPNVYKVAPIDDRRELLAGLLDSDGYVYPSGNSAGTAEFTNTDRQLADDVAFVARSIGLAASVVVCEVRGNFAARTQHYYRVTISGDLTQLPMRVARKKAPKRAGQKNVLHVGFKIERYGEGEFYGFETDGDHLFLLGDFTVVHNCYDIWLTKLAAYNPLLYTGSETPKQKERTKRAFIEGRTNLIVLSLRSGAGIDGFQHRCNTIVFGELDWSPKVHDQCVGRIRRPGQTRQVNALYVWTNGGSDPSVMSVLGVKASQSHGIVDPLLAPKAQHTDDTRIRELAKAFLEGRPAPAPSVPVPVPPVPLPVPPVQVQQDLFGGAA